METLIAIALGLAFLSLAQLIMVYARYRSDQKQWSARRKARAIREKHLIEQVAALRQQLATQRDAHVKRAARHAGWRLMAEQGDHGAVEALIDVEAVVEQEAVLDRVRREQIDIFVKKWQLRDEAAKPPTA